MAELEVQKQKLSRKMPSFSSSLLESIYHSTDDDQTYRGGKKKVGVEDLTRKKSANVEQEIESLRRAIRIEKWIENYKITTKPTHVSSSSGSSTDSTMFSSSETECSASRSTLKPLTFTDLLPRLQVEAHKEKVKPNKNLQLETIPKREGRFTRTKSKAMRIYGDLKKVKEPISPGGKIANFLNSIFSPRKTQRLEEWNSMKKSRSMKDTPTCSLATSSCLTKSPSARCSNKSKRTVRFCPVSTNLDDQKMYNNDEYASSSLPVSGSNFIKRNINSFQICEARNVRKHEYRDFCEDDTDFDNMSCASSDLFELENIGGVRLGSYDEELPIYGTTSLKMNQAISSGLVM